MMLARVVKVPGRAANWIETQRVVGRPRRGGAEQRNVHDASHSHPWTMGSQVAGDGPLAPKHTAVITSEKPQTSIRGMAAKEAWLIRPGT